tara:strand:- start:19183 stop:19653 length:471 start_codon:yes stop_codon:yes gene_type:complete
MTTDNPKEALHEKTSLLGRIKAKLCGKAKNEIESDCEREIHLEPKYWPEVKDFMDNLDNIIESHTIDDNNIKRINQRIIDYIEEQINTKGQVEDINMRYSGLNTLVDRILSNNLSKLVGLKEGARSTADFSNAVNDFKIKLSHKKENEIKQDDSTL